MNVEEQKAVYKPRNIALKSSSTAVCESSNFSDSISEISDEPRRLFSSSSSGTLSFPSSSNGSEQPTYELRMN